MCMLPRSEPVAKKERHMENLRRIQFMKKSDYEGSTGPTLLDPDKAEYFGARMLAYLKNGALAMLMSIGHKLGLFEAMAKLQAVTSVELAQTAELHERYVREWVAAMYVGGILELEEKRNSKPQDNGYLLPRGHAAFLTWGRDPENVAVLTQYISILSSFEDRTMECFRSGKGISNSEV
ncbi:hypothetical protein BWQ96_06634 [Gracilariopsis chorda]|uniref:S-adenosylmethionine-dependent methyltransferase Rv2258c-like winged HTH domain-containing protein n=1 Tax=Gracilariopsis chorda TaxID=448386 RepID=A0A2V3ING9_9FLOR|nr:hypothetical protein BWQ96_06634 [Gracilariopsis chorda]|eukprot:PXF43625.1 hypothetical protein BWQ96_06634 [Gracilariopsis chorda]